MIRPTPAISPKAPPVAWLPWTLCALGTALALYSLSLDLHAPGADLSLLGVIDRTLNASFAAVFGAVGALIVSRQPRHTIGWLLLLIVVPYALPNPTLSGAAVPTWPDVLAAWFSNWSWWLLMGPLLLILLLFPTGSLPSPRWRWAVVALAACFLFFFVLITLGRSLETPSGTGTLPNPIGLLPDDVGANLLFPWELLLVGNVALAVGAIFVRWRRGTPVERQQIKWLLLACAYFLAAFIVSTIFDWVAAGLPSIVFDLAILAIPLAIGIAIVRYRLWDIDVLIRRTLVYALLTGLLALAYFTSVIVLQKGLAALTGSLQAESELVTVLSTLVIAALFVPLRRQVQGLIDRRFYRRKYDAARTLAAFGVTLRDETDLEQLTANLAAVVDETMRPAHVGLWLKTDPGEPALTSQADVEPATLARRPPPAA